MTLDVKDLAFAYEARNVLGGLSFRAREGEILCVLGPNGAGKSTLLRCILGLLDGYDGLIAVDGTSIRSLSRRELARKIAYVPQSPAQGFDYSALDTVLMGATSRLGPFGTPSARDKSMALELLGGLGIEHLAGRGCMKLSGGERQLVLIARALAQRAGILIMDEPTANLDYGNQVRVMQRISELAKRGYTIVLTTHNPEHALFFASRAIAMAAGRIVAEGGAREVLTEEVLEAIYGLAVRMYPLGEDSDGIRVCVPASVCSSRISKKENDT
jgi:iron complex transport system ATP-binding protein